MGLLDGTTQRAYYTNADNHGSYQFTSLDDVIRYFTVAYVGEGKIIPKIKRADIAFHAQRALQELSFDTFKSIKSQEITLPSSLQMILPHDYVNYTKISCVDSSGIKHLLYPTSKTSNPTNPFQNSDGGFEIIANGTGTGGGDLLKLDAQYNNILVGMSVEGVGMQPGTLVAASELTSEGVTRLTLNKTIDNYTNTVTLAEYRFISGNGNLITTPKTQVFKENAETRAGKPWIDFATAQTGIFIGDLVSHKFFPVGTYVTSITAQTGEAYGTRIYVSEEGSETKSGNQEITFTSPTPADSDAWSKYKSHATSENSNTNYEDDRYWPYEGNRYGFSRACAN